MLKKYAAFLKFLSPAAANAGFVGLFLALTIALFTRAYFLSQPMRGDEAYTFLTYVNSGFRSLFDYSAPNNHVLNTLLIKLSTALFSASPASIRFPAFVAGLAAVVLTFFLARLLQKNQNSGIFAAVTVAIFPYLILYSTNARGYSLIVALTLLIASIALRFSNRPSGLDVFLLALFSALGMLAIPIMVLPVAGIFFWLSALLLLKKTPLKSVLHQFVIPFGGLSALLTVAFYAPVIFVSNGLAPILSNKFVKPLSWADFFTQLLPQLQKSFDELTRDVPFIVLLLVFVLVMLGFASAFKTRNWATLLILPSFCLGAACVLFVQHSIPYGRTWIYLIPFVLLLADAGLLWLLQTLPGRLQGFINAALLICALFFAINLTSNNTIARYTDTSGFAEAPIAVQYLKPIFKPGDTLRITNTADWPVYFYFWYDGMSPLLTGQNASTDRIFFIVKKSRGTIRDMATQPVTLLFDLDDLAIYEGKR